MPEMISVRKILGYFVIFCFSIFLVIISGQSPRVLLYAHALNLLFRIITVWLFSRNIGIYNSKGVLTERCSREPYVWEKSTPFRNEHTNKPTGIIAYITAGLTLIFMIGILQMMGSGTDFLKREVLIQEVIWSLLIAAAYWLIDMKDRRFIIASNKSVGINLGYNARGMNFLFAAIFISNFIFVIGVFLVTWLFPGDAGGSVLMVEWVIYTVLTGMILISDICVDRKKSKGSFKNLSRVRTK